MASISELRSRLTLAQSKSVPIRLSNSQCIDLLLKICKKCDFKLISSANGSILLTLEQLEIDILEALESRGGRVSILELPSILKVQKDYIDRAVTNIISKAKSDYMSLYDSLMTLDYVKGLMIALNERLQECGPIDLCEIAEEFDISFDLIKLLIESHLGTILDGYISGNVLEPRIFGQCKLNNVKAALVAITAPTTIQTIAKILKYDINLVSDTISSFIKEGKLKGSLKSGVYIPLRYIEAKRRMLFDCYKTNGYIRVGNVSSFLVNDDFSDLLKETILLDEFYINKEYIEPVSVLVCEAIFGKTWQDISVVLPSVLTDGDFSVLLNHIKGANKEGYLIQGIYVSNQFDQDLTKLILDGIKTLKTPQELSEIIDSQPPAATLETCPTADALLKLTMEVLDANSDTHFSELFLLFQSEIFERIRPSLIKNLISFSDSKPRARPSKDRSRPKELTETLKENLICSELTIKTLEKALDGKIDTSNILLINLTKGLLSENFNLLLESYVIQNGLWDDNEVISSKNRMGLVDQIADEDVKSGFLKYAKWLKEKDPIKAIEAQRDLFDMFYITCNLKKERKTFIKNQIQYYTKQLLASTAADHTSIAFAAINLAILKKNHSIYITNKDWCLKAAINILKPLICDSELFPHLETMIHDPDEGKKEEAAAKTITFFNH